MNVQGHPPFSSVTSAINGFTELEILAQRDKRSAIAEQSESDLQHPLAHPPWSVDASASKELGHPYSRA
jgi:hypothetical protein